MPLAKDFPLERSHQRGVPPKNRYFSTIGSSSVRTVADRHILAAYHNKELWNFRTKEREAPCMELSFLERPVSIASTADDLSGATNIDDLERP